MSKILQIINSLNIGGAERIVADIALSNPKVFDVVSLKKTDSFYEEKLVANKVNYYSLSKDSVYNPLLIIKIIPLLRKYNIVHVHLFPALYWVVLAKLLSLSHVKIIYTEHSTNNRRRNHFVFKLLDRFIYSQLSFIGCISENTNHNLKNHLGDIKTPVKTINNGVDLTRFNPVNISHNYYNFFNKNAFVLMQISSFRIQKDQRTLIRSLVYLPIDIKLILVGDGILVKDHKNLVKELGLEDRVIFLGLREDVPELLNYADVNVLSSHYEGFGLGALEGMAMGKPVVASNVEGLNEVVDGAGLLFEKGNEEHLAKHILTLYNDKVFYNRIADKCLHRSKMFDIKKMFDAYLLVYKEYGKFTN